MPFGTWDSLESTWNSLSTAWDETRDNITGGGHGRRKKDVTLGYHTAQRDAAIQSYLQRPAEIFPGMSRTMAIAIMGSAVR